MLIVYYTCIFLIYSCFLSHVGAFWGAFLAPIIAIILFNVVLFVCICVVVVRAIKRKIAESELTLHKAIFRAAFNICGLMFLFGLTWLFAILTFSVSGVRETFQLLFTISNSLQGAFIFLFTCVFSSDVREWWRSIFKSRKGTKLSHYSLTQPKTFSTGIRLPNSGMSYTNPVLKVIGDSPLQGSL